MVKTLQRAGAVLAGLLPLMGCAHKAPAFRPPTRVEARHRPSWIRSIPVDLDYIVRCLDGREAPSYVLLVYHDPSRRVGMTTVDAYGALEHCVIDGGRVALRVPTDEVPEDYQGLPLFSLGEKRPEFAEANVLEEVISEGSVLGWLYWPRSTANKADDTVGESSTEKLPRAVRKVSP